MGGLEATERGCRRGPRVLCLHARAPALGQAQWLHCLPALGPSRPEGPACPLKAVLDRGAGRSPVRTAQPSPTWASPGSAVAEQSSCCLQQPGAHASEAPRQPQALLPSCYGRWGAGNGGPFCMPRGAVAAPAGLSLEAYSCRASSPGLSLHLSPGPWPGSKGRRPLTTCTYLCQEHLCGQESQPAGPDGWGCSLVLSHSGLYHSLAKATSSPEERRACPLAATALSRPPPVQALPVCRL